MEIPLIIQIENARGVILTAINSVQSKYNFSSCILDSILTQVLLDIKEEEKLEIINGNNKIINEIQNKKGK